MVEDLGTNTIHIRDLENELIEARNRIDLAIEWINNKSIIGEISRPATKKETRGRKPKIEVEKPKRLKRSSSDTTMGIT